MIIAGIIIGVVACSLGVRSRSGRAEHMSRGRTMAMAVTGIIVLAIGLTSSGVGARQGGDPPGNNGTVKVNDVEMTDGSQANDPHVGCTFNVAFFNFDASASSSVSFAAHAPTGSGGLLSDTVALDADGADGSVDAVRTYNLASALVGKFEPHQNQGYHVKLTVNTTGSQGADAKHKVFWVSCGEQATATTIAPTTTTTIAPTTTTTSGATTTTGNAIVRGARVTDDEVGATVRGVVVRASAPGDGWTTWGSRPLVLRSAVASRELSRGVSPAASETELARTGINPVVILGVGLGLMTLGATVLARRPGKLLQRRS